MEFAAIVWSRMLDPILVVPLLAFAFWARNTAEPGSIFGITCSLGLLVWCGEELWLHSHGSRSFLDTATAGLASAPVVLGLAGAAAMVPARNRWRQQRD